MSLSLIRPVDSTFNDDGLADIIIRTSKTDYRAHKWPLRHRSSVFKDMLGFPQPHKPNADECDVVEVVEDSKTIYNLLSVIYESQERQISYIDELSDFAHAAVKYDIAVAIMTAKTLMRQYLAKRIAPLRIFALARKFDFKYVLESAFQVCITLPLTNPALFEDPVLRADLTMGDYQNLLYCKSQRAEAASQIVGNNFRFTALCDVCKRHGCGWLDEYVLMVMLRLRELPTSDVLFEKIIMETCLQDRCPNEADNLEASEAYFTVVRVKIDALPYTYKVKYNRRYCLKTEPNNYASFSQAVEAARLARVNGPQVEEIEEDEDTELPDATYEFHEEEIDCEAVEQLVIG